MITASPERRLADRQKRDLLARGLRALRHGIELADAFECIAEEIEPHGPRMPRRVEIEDAAAHCIFAGLHHRARAVEARRFKALRDLLHGDARARRQPRRRFLQPVERRHALQDGVDRGQHDNRGLAALGVGEPRKRRDAARLDLAVGRNAVVGHAIPGREGHHLGVRREKFELAAQRRKPLSVAPDMQHGLLEARIRGQPPRDRRKQKGVVALRHAGRHNRALAARKLVERRGRGRLSLCGLLLDVGFARHAGITPEINPIRLRSCPHFRGRKTSARRRSRSPRFRALPLS